MKTELLPYQQEAVNKLKRLKVGALYMEQGTGKTRTALEIATLRLASGKVNKVLWLCPCSVRKNLQEDITYHMGGFPVREIGIYGIESLSSSGILFARLLEVVQRNKVFLIIDESSLVKNHAAIRTERIKELGEHCPYRMILNGTPVSKNEADLFAQWDILDWRILGYRSYHSFAANHLEYWRRMLPDGTEIVDKKRIRKVLNVDYLTEKIAPFTYQVRKDDVLTLPPKHYSTRYVSLTGPQRREYEEVKDVYLMSLDEIRPETIYKLFTALQHVVSGRHVLSTPKERMVSTAAYEDPEDNPRIQCLLDIMKELGNEKAIIFCKYMSEVRDVMRTLLNHRYTIIQYTGATNYNDRQTNRERFKDDVQVMVANKACGAYGLNLQFCHNVIYYSNDFDLATRMQSEDRVHRIGQTTPVNIIDICTERTIDEVITRCLQRKKNLVEEFKKEIEKWKEENDGTETVHEQERV